MLSNWMQTFGIGTWQPYPHSLHCLTVSLPVFSRGNIEVYATRHRTQTSWSKKLEIFNKPVLTLKFWQTTVFESFKNWWRFRYFALPTKQISFSRVLFNEPFQTELLIMFYWKILFFFIFHHNLMFCCKRLVTKIKLENNISCLSWSSSLIRYRIQYRNIIFLKFYQCMKKKNITYSEQKIK